MGALIVVGNQAVAKVRLKGGGRRESAQAVPPRFSEYRRVRADRRGGPSRGALGQWTALLAEMGEDLRGGQPGQADAGKEVQPGQRKARGFLRQAEDRALLRCGWSGAAIGKFMGMLRDSMPCPYVRKRQCCSASALSFDVRHFSTHPAPFRHTMPSMHVMHRVRRDPAVLPCCGHVGHGACASVRL